MAEAKPSAMPIEAVGDDARRLKPDEFEARFGNAFLLLTATELSAPKGPGVTEVKLIEDDEQASMHTADLSIMVFPVRRGPNSVTHLITIGRASNNDLVVPDVSVSRFHAFMKHDESGAVVLQDAGSTNGCTVNSMSVAARGEGPPTELKPGDNVRLGQVEFTFVDAAGMRSFALKIIG